MADYTPIKIKVGLKNNNFHKNPDFNSLAPELRSHDGDPDNAQDWAYFFSDQRVCNGVITDCCGHADSDAESPHGVWYNGCLVPPAFAKAAAAAFPGEVTILTEAEWQAFHDDRCMKDMPEHRYDQDVLNAIASQQQIATALASYPRASQKIKDAVSMTDDDLKALDPDDDTPGIRKNKSKHWQDVKKRIGANIV